MKLGKRFAAMGAAMVMAVSMMSMGASASSSTWQNYNLHWTKGAPTSEIVTYKEIGDNTNNKVFLLALIKKLK